MSQVVLIQGSLNKESRTAVLVDHTAEEMKRSDLKTTILDLRNIQMEFCDGRSLKEYHPDMQQAYQVMKKADAFVIGMPVYCYSVSGPLKNFIDITSGAMEKKIAGILCNAGGNRSYMSSADLSNILAYESHVTTVQPIVYSSSEDFDDHQLTGNKVKSKIREMVDHLARHLKNSS
jgi:NAD(P)H-dependent FMN reductase